MTEVLEALLAQDRLGEAAVARRLGMRSVDRTFLLIGEDWQSQEA